MDCSHKDCEIIYKELSWSNKWVRTHLRCLTCDCVISNSARATVDDWINEVPYTINPQGCSRPSSKTDSE